MPNYINNKELYVEIVISKAQGKLTRKATTMLVELGERIIRKMYYESEDLEHDCLQSGLEAVFSRWYNYNIDYENPFAYFTEVFKRGMAFGYNQYNFKTKGLHILSIERSNENKGLNGI